MSRRDRKRPNTLNVSAIATIKAQIAAAWPWTNVVKAFYIEDPAPLGVSESMAFKRLTAAASVEVRGDDANVCIYRKPEPGDKHDYDVDEIRGATATIVTIPEKSNIDGHHLTGSITDDVMRRNNIAPVVVADGNGGLRLDVRPDGLVNACINFEDEAQPP